MKKLCCVKLPAAVLFLFSALGAPVSADPSCGAASFRFATVGGFTWTAANLNCAKHARGKSWCYGDDPANCAKYGRLYDWEAAMSVCPSGWRLPSLADWQSLVSRADPSSDRKGGNYAAPLLKSPSGWNGGGDGFPASLADKYGFSALPGGCYDSDPDGSRISETVELDFKYMGSYGFWWTSTERGADSANTVDMRYNANNVGDGGSYDAKSMGFSVRCMKDY